MNEATENIGVRAYVISLTSAHARRHACRAQLEGRLPYTIIDAVDGGALGEAELRAVTRNMHSNRLGRALTRGEVGCSLSHKRALETFLASGEAWGLVLEDDFSMPSESPAALIHLLEFLRGRSDVDIVKLGGADPWTAPGRLVGHTSGCDIIATTTFGLLAHAYLVSRDGGRRLANSLIPIREPFDHHLRSDFLFDGRVHETSPWLFGLDTALMAESSLQTERAAVQQNHVSWPARARRRWERLVYSLFKARAKARRFGWLALFSNSSFRRFPTGGGSP